MCNDSPAPQGDGAPDIELIADVIEDHFSSRWGQDSQVSRVEARLVASEVAKRLIRKPKSQTALSVPQG